MLNQSGGFMYKLEAFRKGPSNNYVMNSLIIHKK